MLYCVRCNSGIATADNDKVCYECASLIVNRRQLDVSYVQKKVAMPEYIFEAVKMYVKIGLSIQAIKYMRSWSADKYGKDRMWGLRESKDFVDYIRDYILPKVNPNDCKF